MQEISSRIRNGYEEKNQRLQEKQIYFCGALHRLLRPAILSLASDMSVGPLKYVSGYVITPIQKGLNEVGNWISDKGVYLQSNVDYAAQCKELQEKVDQLTAENTELLADREEKERLEKQLELSAQYDYDKVGARVIARDSDNWFNVFTH